MDFGPGDFGGFDGFAGHSGGSGGMGCGCLLMFLVVLWVMLAGFFALGYFVVKDVTTVAGGM